MSQQVVIQNDWIQDLFGNEKFRSKLKQFTSCSNQIHKWDSSEGEVSMLSQEISEILYYQVGKQRQRGVQTLRLQVSKINYEIMSLKNALLGGCQKSDLELTHYNRNKLDFSSILDQDTGTDVTDFKSSIEQLHHKFDDWFQAKSIQKNTLLDQTITETKLSRLITQRCDEALLISRNQLSRRLQASQLSAQRRIQQVTKTLNNVLQMLNEANNKKMQANQSFESHSDNYSGVQHSLARQSSLQNLKIKNLFNFGHK